jgi:hypothetical protein
MREDRHPEIVVASREDVRTVRTRMREQRLRQRVRAARRLRSVPPEETLEAAFDLIEFTQELSRGSP